MKLSKKAEFADFGGDRGDREVVHDGRAVRNARAAADAKNVGPKTFTRKDSKFKMDANPLPRKPPPVAESVAPKTFTRKDSKFSMDANPLSQAAMSKGGGSGGGSSAAASAASPPFPPPPPNRAANKSKGKQAKKKKKKKKKTAEAAEEETKPKPKLAGRPASTRMC